MSNTPVRSQNNSALSVADIERAITLTQQELSLREGGSRQLIASRNNLSREAFRLTAEAEAASRAGAPDAAAKRAEADALAGEVRNAVSTIEFNQQRMDFLRNALVGQRSALTTAQANAQGFEDQPPLGAVSVTSGDDPANNPSPPPPIADNIPQRIEPQPVSDDPADGSPAAESGSDDPLGVPYESPEEVQEENSFSDDSDGNDPAVDDGEEGDFLGEGANPSPDNTAAVAGAVQARQQATLRAQRQQKAAAGDWRVRLQLAPGADYLYKAKDNAGILAPLALTDGVIFPYTPAIEMAYKANYSSYDLTHSNFKGYFYQNSSVDAVNITATFTAQDSAEANYLLAVIHFFRSVTKMFYGQDAERGAPPPLVYLSGLGEYQFAEHPCVVSNFAYTLPKEVDYIRARSSFTNGTSLLTKRERQSVPSTPLGYTLNRLASVGLPRGAMPQRLPPPTLGTNSPTYVPTKIDMTITLLPMQSRKEVSSQFSLKNFANGNLLRGGFW